MEGDDDDIDLQMEPLWDTNAVFSGAGGDESSSDAPWDSGSDAPWDSGSASPDGSDFGDDLFQGHPSPSAGFRLDTFPPVAAGRSGPSGGGGGSNSGAEAARAPGLAAQLAVPILGAGAAGAAGAAAAAGAAELSSAAALQQSQQRHPRQQWSPKRPRRESQSQDDAGIATATAAPDVGPMMSESPAAAGAPDFDERVLPQAAIEGQLFGSESTDLLDQKSVYEILSDPRQAAQGARPDFIQLSDIGAVFLERQDGTPQSQQSRAGRRAAGLEQWKQSDLSSIQRVPRVSFGKDRKGEVWIKKMYGKILPPRNKPRSSAPAQSYHSYYLCYYLNGRDRNAPRSEAGKSADFMRGCIYHVIANPPDTSPGGMVGDVKGGVVVGAPQAAAPRLPVSVAVPGQRQSSIPLDIKLLDATDPAWLRFEDETGTEQGTLHLRDGKLALGSKGGDFAEFHVRNPEEPAFEEGDLVAFGPRGLTRQTAGSQKLGVISRRAVVIGTMPDATELRCYDTVAYCGLVPVKLRGDVSDNDFVVPSGHADGTAVAMHHRPRASVGRVCELDMHRREENTCCCTRKRQAVRMVTVVVFSPAETVQLRLKTRPRLLAERAILALLLLLAVAWVAQHCLHVWHVCAPVSLQYGTLYGDCSGRYGASCSYEQCDPGYAMVSAAANPSDASAGKDYTHLDAMVRRTRHCETSVVTALLSFGRQSNYDGADMRCARTVCTKETIRMGCDQCAGKEASITFPETVPSAREAILVFADYPPGFSGNVSRRCGATGWGTPHGHLQRLHCPRKHIALDGGPATMSVEAQNQCYQFEHSDDSTGHSTHVSMLCKRLFRHTLTFDEVPEGYGRRTVACPFPYYSGSMSASCANSSMAWSEPVGTCVRRVCPAEWRQMMFCNHTRCNGDAISNSSTAVQVQLPQQELSLPSQHLPSANVSEVLAIAHASVSDIWSVVPCCSEFSSTGSCADEHGAFGFVISRCVVDEQGEPNHEIWNSSSWDRNPRPPSEGTPAQTGCQLPKKVISGVRLDQSSKDAAMLFRKFSNQFSDKYTERTSKYWALPKSGSLSSVSVSMRAKSGADEWRPITAVPRKGPHCQDASLDQSACEGQAFIDTNRFDGSLPHGSTFESAADLRREFGRPAAAFADVSCRQLGFKRAALVTNCRALFELMKLSAPRGDETPEEAEWWEAKRLADSETDLFLELCPEFRGNGPGNRKSISETMCDRWLDVPDQPMGQSKQWETWLQVMAYNKVVQPRNFSLAVDSFFRQMPSLEQEHGDGDYDPPISPIPAQSSCSGAESDIRQCFWSQVHQMQQAELGNMADVSSATMSMSRPCESKIVVGCTDEHSATDLIAAQAAHAADVPPVSPHEGVWVIGDARDHYDSDVDIERNLWSPKIFTHFDGPFNCSEESGEYIAYAERTPRRGRPGSKATPHDGGGDADWCWGKLLNPGSAEDFRPVAKV
jgi:hypothetical protein